MCVNGVERVDSNLPCNDVRRFVAENPVEGISADDLRRLLYFGCAAEVLPPSALETIRSQGLSLPEGDLKQMPMERAQKVIASFRGQ